MALVILVTFILVGVMEGVVESYDGLVALVPLTIILMWQVNRHVDHVRV